MHKTINGVYKLYEKPMITRKLIRQLAEDLYDTFGELRSNKNFDFIWDEMTKTEQDDWETLAMFAIGAVRTHDAVIRPSIRRKRKIKPSPPPLQYEPIASHDYM